MTVPTEVHDVERLTAADRCSRCDGQAYVKTAHVAGDLLWCGHHFREHQDALSNFVVIDERSRLAVDEAARLT